MALRTVEESSLTSVADAIREGTGTSDPLVFPEGFKERAKSMANAVKFTEQDLTEEQKAQARANIGAAAVSEGGSGEIPIYAMEGAIYNTEGTIWEATNLTCKHTDIIPVSPGDRFLYSGRGRFNVPSVLWYDNNQTVISYEQYYDAVTNWPSENVTVIVPSGVSYARFCSYSEIGYECVLAIYRLETPVQTSPLYGKKIVYDGDSICYGAGYKGGYAKLIAEKVGGTYDNQGIGGGRLRTLTGSADSFHSVVDNLVNLPTDGDLYCFEGGINDYWTKGVLGSFDYTNFTGELDTTTVCGALETIFRYCLNNFVGKPVCFVITHKIQGTAYSDNSNGDSFKDYHDAMVGICEKYSIPYYDAFNKSGLNGWNTAQNNAYLTGNSAGEPDGCHPNEQGYKRYYVPQLIALFESMMPEDVTEPDVPAAPTYTNVLDEAGYKAGVYISNGNEGVDANAFTTGYIPVPDKATIYLKNITMPDESSHGNRVAFYKADKSFRSQVSVTSSLTGWNAVFDGDGNLVQFYYALTDVGYMRLSAWNIDEASIITVNEPID